MPLYEYECAKCKALTQELRAVADRTNGPVCYRCSNNRMDLVIISAPMGVVKNPAVPRGSK
jgi:putative FmdB family regulatory protein